MTNIHIVTLSKNNAASRDITTLVVFRRILNLFAVYLTREDLFLFAWLVVVLSGKIQYTIIHNALMFLYDVIEALAAVCLWEISGL